MQVLIFTKPTESSVIKLSGGGEYISSNSKHVCSYSTNQCDHDVIAYGIAECKKVGSELGLIQEVSTIKGGFYAGGKAHVRTVYNWELI